LRVVGRLVCLWLNAFRAKMGPFIKEKENSKIQDMQTRFKKKKKKRTGK
jgi:hypothetical protein